MTLSATWKSAKRKATQPSNPKYSNGVVIANDNTGPACRLKLDYPAPECGVWLVECDSCGMSMVVTAAGRKDDPFEVWVPCIQQ